MRHNPFDQNAINGFGMTLNSNFQDLVNKLRERHDISADNELESRIKILENPKFDKEVKDLIINFKLPNHWEKFISEYIVFDDPIPTYDLNGPSLISKVDKNGNEELFLKIFKGKTTISSIKKKLKNHLARREKKTYKAFWRHYEIYKLANEGKTIDEIWTEVKEKYKDLEYGTIKKIVSKFQKQFKTGKKYKLITSREKSPIRRH